jgi:murein DD-endopeptidase MepM/ murein hydrolase activator NlpD
VQYSGYQGGGAGYYLVVDGRSTALDYVYMHLERRDRAREGEHVRTGEQIGHVGDTGNASGCHLHFELWSKPGWYEGGHAMRTVTRHLRKWDHWS